ncbi:uncharacterized protein THITE_2130005 [Thermothielavioides terrestris NRRL 8126]|uniref:Uncharacterized protein n=1 Tax=Thermothielavioides terrestris (strain ATCC 38088 / NRRL 8126) TaxID=578455 RepID=G2R8N4_THETT|nr:uncharacterized protein THITE_2130005 [Thermothielavioides terrestris NRRL 8126]AEO68250.1 hypothetical protein THITE_2130005 [Thermothielavioides terrestris NRRL 8126]
MAAEWQGVNGPMLLGVSWGLTVLATIIHSLRVCLKLSTGRHLSWDDWILTAGLGSRRNRVTTPPVKMSRPARLDCRSGPIELILRLSSRATVTITAIVWTKTAFAFTLFRAYLGRY